MTRHKKYSYGLYRDAVHTGLRNKIKKCMYCGLPEKSKEVKRLGMGNVWVTARLTNLNVHHIDGDKTNNSLSNLTVLCQKCHGSKGHILVKKNGKIVTVLVNRKTKFRTLEEEFGGN